MYAIVDVAGEQCKVEKAAVIRVPKLEQEPGKKVSFDKVLMIVDDGKVNIGHPFVNNAVVMATIVQHAKDKKVLVFKKKRRKGYQKLNGHRQEFTEVQIDAISVSVKSEAAPKKEAPKAAEKKSGDEKPEVAAPKASASESKSKATAAAKPRTAAAKKPAAKKPAAKKAAPKDKPADSEKET